MSSRHFGSIIVLVLPVTAITILSIHLLSLAAPALLISFGLKSNYWMLSLCVLSAYMTYLAGLLILTGLSIRLIPKPPEGRLGKRSDFLKHVILLALLHALRISPARFFIGLTPFPSYLFFWLAGAKISFSATVSNPDALTDPWFIEIGDNAIVGQGAVLVGHLQAESNQTTLARIKVGRDAVIGVYSVVMAGSTIGEGSTVQAHSLVKPFTQIPSGEIWGGIPAVKIKSKDSRLSAELNVSVQSFGTPDSTTSSSKDGKPQVASFDKKL